MGKKKASKTKKTKPQLEQFISKGLIYVRPIRYSSNGDKGYEFVFGRDGKYNEADTISVLVYLDTNSKLKYYFSDPTKYLLNDTGSNWFIPELHEILVMHKLGAYVSKFDWANLQLSAYGNELNKRYK